MPSVSLYRLALWGIMADTSSAFYVSSRAPHGRVTTTLRSSEGPTSTVISPEDTDFQFDTGLGGVRLAEESAIRMSGSIQHGSSRAKATLRDLTRYTGVQEVTDAQVQQVLNNVVQGKVICTGRGRELYKDPGNSLEKIVVLGPSDAAEDAALGASPASDAANVVINVLGGDDLQFLEVKDALEALVPKLAIGKAKVNFHSLCHSSFPMEQVTITAVALSSESSSNGLSGAEKAVADGEVYFRDGKWWTVVESDINPALA